MSHNAVLQKSAAHEKESIVHQPIGTPPVCVEVIITAANEEWLAYLAHTLINDRIVARGHTTAPGLLQS